MKRNYYLTISDEFIKYCELNNISNIEEFANKLLNEAFMELKYPKEPPVTQNKKTVKQTRSIYEE